MAKTTKPEKQAKPVKAEKSKSKNAEETKITPIKEKLSARAFNEELMARTGLDKKQVASVMAAFGDMIAGALHKKGIGEITFPKLFKIKVKATPAKKGGVKKENPMRPGEFYVTKNKPASRKPRFIAVKQLKELVDPSLAALAEEKKAERQAAKEKAARKAKKAARK